QRHRGGGGGRRRSLPVRLAPPAWREGPGRQEEETVRPWGIAGLVLVCACSRSAADHEELGDRAYAAGEYRNALAEYQLGLKAHPGSADLSAKAGAAALHTGDYALAAVRARACSTAVPAFESVIRRQHEPAVTEGAREGLGLCALVEGQRLLADGKPTEAEDWFRRASAPGSPPEVVRGAFLGLGDVKLAQGDITNALDNYQQVLSGGRAGDTLSQRAHEKINALGKADAPSTTPPTSFAKSPTSTPPASTRPSPCYGRATPICGCGGVPSSIRRTASRRSRSTRSLPAGTPVRRRRRAPSSTCNSCGSGSRRRTTRTGCSI